MKTATRVLWSAVGCAAGLGMALLMTGQHYPTFLLASLGGSAVFLFGLGSMPAAQPRALLGGHMGGALMGILCGHFLGEALWVYVLSQALTWIVMLACKAIHPPAAANPLIMLHEHAGFDALLNPVLLGIVCLMAVAMVWSRLRRDTHRYPFSWTAGSLPPDWGGVRAAALGERNAASNLHPVRH